MARPIPLGRPLLCILLGLVAWRVSPGRSCGADGEPALSAALERSPQGPLPAGLLVAARSGVERSATAGGWGVPQLAAAVNTSGVDCAPAISYQGDRLFFERPTGPQELNDIFVSAWTDTGWTAPQNLGPPINTDAYSESKPFVSAGGDSLLFTRLGDIYMATWNGSSWNEPQPFSDAINSPHAETSPCLSADGQEFYFTSTRPGGYGWNDIYVSTWDGLQWSTPQNLGPNVNTSDNEWYCCLSADGARLYFITSRPGGYGNIDVWVTVREPGGWSLPASIGGLANSSGASCKPSISADGRTLYFGGARPGEGVGSLDIWYTTWTEGGAP